MWLEKEGFMKAMPDEITNDIVSRFFVYLINDRNLDQRTVAKYKQHLHNLFSWFVSKKIGKEIPLKHVPRAVKKVDVAARPISDKHMAIYLDYVKTNDRQLLVASLFQLLLLCRPNQELRLMKIQDVDLAKQIAYIRDENAKTKARVITMPVALVEIADSLELDRYPGDYYIFGRSGKPRPVPVGVNYFNRKFSIIKKTLGLPGTYKFYSFKHTGAGKLLESGATLAELMSHLGHTKFESTIHYVRRHFGEKSEKIMNFKPDFLNGLNI
jgi:integrase